MKCSKCKEPIYKYGEGSKHYAFCDCADWKLVRCD